MSKVNPCLQIETLDLFLPMASCLLIKFFMKRKFHCFHLRMRRKLVWGSNRVRFLFSLSCVSCIAVIYYELDKVFSTDVNVNMIMKIHPWKVFSRNRLPLKELKQFHWNSKEERWLTYVSMGGGGRAGGAVVRVRVPVKYLWWSFLGKSCRKAPTLMFLLFETIRCKAYYKTALVRGRHLFQS